MPTWESVAGRTYFQGRTTDLAFPASVEPVASNIPSQEGVTSYTNRLTGGANFDLFQIGVE